MMNRLFSVVLLGGFLLLLASCSDPTGVGSELVGSEEQGTPQFKEVRPDSFATVSSPSLTGFVRPPSSFQSGGGSGSWRFLAGTVKDPIVGTIEAEGYVDFLGNRARSGSVIADPVDSLSAELRLQPTYFHGDTLSTYEVNLFELSEEADMQRAPADTSFEVRRKVGETVSVSGRALTDSVLAIPLDEKWIRDHLDVLRADTSFGDDVAGFKIAAANNNPTLSDPQVVAGFELNSATLRLTTTSDTIDFRGLKSFTHVERRDSPAQPLGDRRLLVDGVADRLYFSWDYDRPAFTKWSNTPLNQAEITVPIDDSTMDASLELLGNPPAFVRPEVNGYRIRGTRAEEAPSCSQIGLPVLSGDSNTCLLPTNTSAAPGAAQLTSQLSFTIMERVLFESPLFSGFQAEIATRTSPNASAQGTIGRGLPSTLPVLVRTDISLSDEKLPRTTLIVTPLSP